MTEKHRKYLLKLIDLLEKAWEKKVLFTSDGSEAERERAHSRNQQAGYELKLGFSPMVLTIHREIYGELLNRPKIMPSVLDWTLRDSRPFLEKIGKQ